MGERKNVLSAMKKNKQIKPFLHTLQRCYH